MTDCDPQRHQHHCYPNATHTHATEHPQSSAGVRGLVITNSRATQPTENAHAGENAHTFVDPRVSASKEISTGHKFTLLVGGMPTESIHEYFDTLTGTTPNSLTTAIPNPQLPVTSDHTTSTSSSSSSLFGSVQASASLLCLPNRPPLHHHSLSCPRIFSHADLYLALPLIQSTLAVALDFHLDPLAVSWSFKNHRIQFLFFFCWVLLWPFSADVP